MPAGEARQRTLVLRNTGDAAYTVQSLSINGGGFSLLDAVPPFTVAAGSVRPVTISFSPSSHGVSVGSLVVNGAPVAIAGLTGIGLNAAAPNSLLAWWNFNDSANAAGSTDVVHGFPGLWASGGKHSAAGGGRTGTAADRSADFTATGNDRMELANARWFRAASAVDKLTICFWQKNTLVIESASFHFVSPTGADGQRGAMSHCPWVDSRIYWDTGGGSNTALHRISTGPPAGHNYLLWHHYAFVKDGSAKEIWIDGVRIANGTNTAPLAGDIESLILGSASAPYGLQAFMDDFAVYSGALSGPQIQQLAGGAAPDSILAPPSGPGFRITGVSINPVTRALTLTWPSEAGAVYSVQRSTDLLTWQNVQTGIASGGATTTFTAPPPAAGQTKVYYRIAIGP